MKEFKRITFDSNIMGVQACIRLMRISVPLIIILSVFLSADILSQTVLNGTVNANGLSTTTWYKYGVTSGLYRNTLAPQIVIVSSDTNVSISIGGLSSEATHYYRIAAQNSARTSYGNENTFTAIALLPPKPTIFPTVMPTPTAINGNLCGRVTDSVTGKGINGATVTIEDTGIQGMTGRVQGQDGVYCIPPLLSEGAYIFTAEAEGYIPASKEVIITSHPPDLNFALMPVIPTPTPTPGHPKATTTESWGSQCGATFNGIVNANGLPTTVWFEVNKYYDTYISSTVLVNGWDDTPVTISEDFSDNLWDGGSYPFRIVAQNSTGITYGNEEEITIFYVDKFCTVTGYVLDQTTLMGIANATIIPINPNYGSKAYTNASGYYEWAAYEFPCAGGCYALAVSANGYKQSLPKTSCQGLCDGAGKLNFELLPLVIPSPTPLCEADSINAFPKALKLKRYESDNATITVLCEDGSPVVGQPVTAKIKSGKKRISVTPESQATNIYGQAIFTITAMNKTGDAKVKFETTNGLKTTVFVKIKGK